MKWPLQLRRRACYVLMQRRFSLSIPRNCKLQPPCRYVFFFAARTRADFYSGPTSTICFSCFRLKNTSIWVNLLIIFEFENTFFFCNTNVGRETAFFVKIFHHSTRGMLLSVWTNIYSKNVMKSITFRFWNILNCKRIGQQLISWVFHCRTIVL